jgi:predicted acetyltransferase
MLKLALIECRKIGLEKILLTCDTDNIPSNKVIQRNGGILENIIIWE